MAQWELGEIVRAARIRQGLTQEELGRQVGVSKDGISRFERGQASLSLDHGARLAQALGLPVRTFLQRLADARGERALLSEMLNDAGAAEQQNAGEQPEGAQLAEEDELTESQADEPFKALPRADKARRRSRRSVIERQIDLRDLRVTVRLSFAQPASLEIEVAPTSER